AAFYDRARAARVRIIHTGIVIRPDEPPEAGLGRREDEPLLYPDAYDKFMDERFRALVAEGGTRNLVITGGGINNAVMYTATGAARNHGYDVYIPYDGVYGTPYAQEYAVHQLSQLPSIRHPVQFTTLSLITFS